MVLPLLLLGGGILADFLFQWFFEQERKKEQLRLLEEGYSAEDVVYTDVESEPGLFQPWSFDEDPGASFLRSALFG